MTIRSIDDFLSKPQWWELCLLGCSQFACVIVLSLVWGGYLPGYSAGIALITMSMCLYLFHVVQKKRASLAAQFYEEWLHALDEEQLTMLKRRLPDHRSESDLVEHVLENRQGKPV